MGKNSYTLEHSSGEEGFLTSLLSPSKVAQERIGTSPLYLAKPTARDEKQENNRTHRSHTIPRECPKLARKLSGGECQRRIFLRGLLYAPWVRIPVDIQRAKPISRARPARKSRSKCVFGHEDLIIVQRENTGGIFHNTERKGETQIDFRSPQSYIIVAGRGSLTLFSIHRLSNSLCSTL